MRTKKQKEASDKGTATEVFVENWLRERNFQIIDSHGGKKSAKHYDILAARGKEKWIIDVKTGEKPGVRISNFEKMLKKRLQQSWISTC